jgi:hypothetical protein
MRTDHDPVTLTKFHDKMPPLALENCHKDPARALGGSGAMLGTEAVKRAAGRIISGH